MSLFFVLLLALAIRAGESVTSYQVDEKLACKDAKQFNTSSFVRNAPGKIFYYPILVATSHEDTLSAKGLPAEEDVSFLFLRLASRESSRAHMNDAICTSSEVRSWGTQLLTETMTAYADRKDKRPTYAESVTKLTKQQRMFAHMNIIGRHDALSTANNQTYYRLLKSDSIFVHDVTLSAFAASNPFASIYEAYVFHWRPPKEGRYRLTLDVDFANCKSPLMQLDSKANASLHDDFCDVIFAPALQMDVNVYSTAAATTTTAVATNVHHHCDLSDMSQDSYWMYPAVLTSVTVGNLFKYAFPMWHSPACPSFHHRQKRVASKMLDVCMIGDSNTMRTCDHINKIRKRCVLVGKGTEDAFTITEADLNAGKEPGFMASLKQCLRSNKLVSINMGHHIPQFAPMSELQKPLKAIRSAIDSNWANKKQADAPLMVWATLASHVSRFSSLLEEKKFPFLLALQSNAYREMVQNEETKKALTSGAKNIAFIDLFSPTLALGEISHDLNDPVHFSSDAFAFGHSFIYQALMVAEDCHAHNDCFNSTTASTTNSGAGVPPLPPPRHSTWAAKESIAHFNEKSNNPFPSRIDYDAFALMYVPPPSLGWETRPQSGEEKAKEQEQAPKEQPRPRQVAAGAIKQVKSGISHQIKSQEARSRVGSKQ